MSIKSFQMKDLLEQVAIAEAKKKKAEEDDEEDEMDEEFVVEKKSSEEDDEEDDEEDQEDDEEDDEEDEDNGEKKETADVKKMEKKAHMKEDTTAALSLKPNARGVDDPKSKIGMITAVIGAMHAMKKDDLTKWFHDTQSQFGPGKDYGVGDKSASNQASVDMKGGAGPKTRDPMPKLKKLSVKEDVEEMFAGSDLSEEFKDNAATLFEAAVNARAMVEIARLEEEYENAFVESVTEITEELTSKLDSYLEYVTEQWMEANEVAIESTLRNELMEEFIGGLKGLFAEHYIDVPQEKVNVIEALAEKVESLEAVLDEAINENVELKRTVAEVEKEEILESLCDGLALSQVEKFKALAEGIDFDGDLETYGRKLTFVKESYFANKKQVVSTNIEEETFEGETSTNTVSIDPVVNRYVQAITKNLKK